MYRDRLQEGDFQYISEEIFDRFGCPTRPWATKAVVIHQMMNRLFDYSNYAGGKSSPSETLRNRSGNCVDKGVLAANLYLAAGFDVRLLGVSDSEDERHHLTLQVKMPVDDPSAANQVLRDTKHELFFQRPGKISWSSFQDGYYYFAEPGWCSYLGDRKGLDGDYVADSGDSWAFCNINEERFVEADDFCNYTAGMGSEGFASSAVAELNTEVRSWS